MNERRRRRQRDDDDGGGDSDDGVERERGSFRRSFYEWSTTVHLDVEAVVKWTAAWSGEWGKEGS